MLCKLYFMFLVGGPEDAKHCPVRKQVTFAKTHKTGSSTVQNILFRYGQRHNLSFAFPLKNTWMFNLSKPFEVSNSNWCHVLLKVYMGEEDILHSYIFCLF